MLTSLSIRDVVLIEALDLDFANGLGVLTGETGAGKSILLDALGLALGDRADSGLVRQGCAQASVTASFSGPQSALQLLTSNDLDIGAGEDLIVRRTVKADGGSRAWINDQPVSAALLRELGGSLVEIHGQHDDRGLINPKGHRDLLDSFARADTAAVRLSHAAWRNAEATLASARQALEDAERDREWLAHAVAELKAFDPQPGEEEDLAGRRALMSAGKRSQPNSLPSPNWLRGVTARFPNCGRRHGYWTVFQKIIRRLPKPLQRWIGPSSKAGWRKINCAKRALPCRSIQHRWRQMRHGCLNCVHSPANIVFSPRRWPN